MPCRSDELRMKHSIQSHVLEIPNKSEGTFPPTTNYYSLNPSLLPLQLRAHISVWTRQWTPRSTFPCSGDPPSNWMRVPRRCNQLRSKVVWGTTPGAAWVSTAPKHKGFLNLHDSS